MDTMERTLARPKTRFSVHTFFVLFALALGCLGCKSNPKNPFLEHLAADESAQEKTTPEPGNDSQPDEARASDTSTPFDVTALADDSKDKGWYEKIEPFGKRTLAQRHWYHSKLEGLMKRTPKDRPDLSLALAGSNPVVAANAAIVEAHWGAGDPIVPLAAVVREKKLPTKLRCVAAEALGLVRQPSPAPQLRELLQQIAGPIDKKEFSEGEEGQNPEIHAELIRALARQAQSGDEAWFNAALRSPAWMVRVEGLWAWAQVTDQDLPMQAIDLRSDQDARVRAAAIWAIAAHRDPHAVEYLQQALADRVLDVHATAVTALGDLGSEEAHELLTTLKKNRSELTRAASVAALAAAGMRDEVEDAAKDASQHVRLAVAQTLSQASQQGRQVAAQTVATVQNLAHDSSNEVQRQAMESLATWPIEQAGPVLLLAIAEGGYTARKTAARQLAERWTPAAGFPLDAMAERRATALVELKKLWIQQYGEINDDVVEAKAQARQLITLSEERIAEVQKFTTALQQANLPEAARREAMAALVAAGPQLVAVLEQRGDLGGRLPPELYDDVLPSVNAAFALLRRLSSPDLMQRRSAATELAALAAGQALSPLVVERLAELVEAEKDPVIWRSALLAVANDSRETAVRMAYTAIGNDSVEVRRRACDYLAAHGDPRHVAVLLPVLQDPDATVVMAAVNALGYVGTLDDLQPLIGFLNSPDKWMRLEAAASLTRLKAIQGVAAMERLALDSDAKVRMRAAQTMGELADPAFLPTLIAMLEDKGDVPRMAMTSLAQIAGTDAAVGKDGAVLPNDEKIRRWQQWYKDHPTPPDAKR